MIYRIFALTSITQSTIENEIAFSVASARAEGAELVRLDFNERNVRLKPFAERVLRGLRRKGRIQLFLASENISKEVAEAQYMRNKYRDFMNLCQNGRELLIIKL